MIVTVIMGLSSSGEWYKKSRHVLNCGLLEVVIKAIIIIIIIIIINLDVYMNNMTWTT